MSDDRPLIVETRTRSGGSGWLIAAVLIVGLIVGLVFFSRTAGSEAAKDNAVADAASSVGQAAKDVGNAAQDAANSTK